MLGVGRLRRWALRLGLDPAVTVAGGPGCGLRIGLRNASAEYGAGTNELPVQEAIVGRLHDGDVFFDVGANIGFFSLLAARAVGPLGKVVAFEAVPANAKCIEVNARRNGFENVAVQAVAAGAGPATAQLHLARHPGGAVLASAGQPPDPVGTVEVRVVAIDDLVQRGEVPIPDVVKIDVEGAEDAVLAGLHRTLVAHGPVIVLEVDDATEKGLEARLEGFERDLESLGYVLERLPRSYEGNDWRVAHLVAARRAPHDAHRAEL